MLSNLGRQHFHLGIDYGFPTASGPGRTPLLEIIERDMQEKRPKYPLFARRALPRKRVRSLTPSGRNRV
jgi:hypothetical protein